MRDLMYMRIPAIWLCNVAVAAAWFASATPADASAAVRTQSLTRFAKLHSPKLSTTPIALESVPLIVRSVYAHVKLPKGSVAATGAVGSNANLGTAPGVTLTIGTQRAGAPYVAAGIMNHRHDQVLAGWRIFDWGWQHQAADGGFPDSQRYNVAFFVVAQARSALMLVHSSFARVDHLRISAVLPKLQAACRWMLRPDIAALAASHESAYNHRDYLTGTALASTDALARSLHKRGHFATAEADTLLKGVRRQWKNGVNPELNGWDASYQAVGVGYAEEWLQLRSDWRTPVGKRMLAMTDRAISWLKSRIGPTGILNHVGDTRTSGPTKGPSYISIERALAYWGALTGDRTASRIARLVSHWVGSPLDSTPAVADDSA